MDIGFASGKMHSMKCAGQNKFSRTLSVAPMMDWTDRHCRYFHRLLAPGALLYTEMVTTGALIHGDAERLLAYNAEEHPLALQLGGSDPGDLARCARIAQVRGFDEVNLNVGCPSDRVQRGRFGACLMLEPRLVKDCMAAMLDAVEIPVTVKSRLGVDEHESYAFVRDFVGHVAESGCSVFILHARKAVLDGLSPKQNRVIPPLRYEWVYRLKREMPELTIVINGGIGSIADVARHLENVDGVMLGRAAYQTPWLLAQCQAEFLGGGAVADREAAVDGMSEYMEREAGKGVPVKHVARHLLGLFHGRPGGKIWRRHLSEQAWRDDANTELLRQACAEMKARVR